MLPPDPLPGFCRKQLISVHPRDRETLRRDVLLLGAVHLVSELPGN